MRPPQAGYDRMSDILLFQILALALSVVLVLGTIYSIRLYLEI